MHEIAKKLHQASEHLVLLSALLLATPSLASRRADLAQVVSLTTLDPGVDSSRTPERRFPEPGPGFPE